MFKFQTIAQPSNTKYEVSIELVFDKLGDSVFTEVSQAFAYFGEWLANTLDEKELSKESLGMLFNSSYPDDIQAKKINLMELAHWFYRKFKSFTTTGILERKDVEVYVSISPEPNFIVTYSPEVP